MPARLLADYILFFGEQYMHLYKILPPDIEQEQHDEYGYIGKEHEENDPGKNIDQKE